MKDKSRSWQYLESLDRLLKDWEECRKSASLDKLRKDRFFGHSICYVMLESIQAAIDLGNHVIVERQWERPAKNRETFEVLARRRFISAASGKSLANLSGFRNLLVHRYTRLDFGRVLKNLKSGIRPLRHFQAKVLQRL